MHTTRVGDKKYAGNTNFPTRHQLLGENWTPSTTKKVPPTVGPMRGWILPSDCFWKKWNEADSNEDIPPTSNEITSDPTKSTVGVMHVTLRGDKNNAGIRKVVPNTHHAPCMDEGRNPLPVIVKTVPPAAGPLLGWAQPTDTTMYSNIRLLLE